MTGTTDPMKASFTLVVLILAVAAMVGVRDHERVAAAREINRKLKVEAHELGITGGPGERSAAAMKHSQGRDRAARETHAREYAARLVRFVIELEARQKEGPLSEDMQEQIFEMIDGMLQLDGGQLNVLIESLRVDSSLTTEMKRNIIGFAITTLARDHPAAAVEVFTGSSDVLPPGSQSEHVLGEILSRWAGTDPDAALEWLRVHGSDSEGLVTERVKHSVVGGVAKQDPGRAFHLIDRLGITDIAGVGQRIADHAGTAAERDAVLAALRAHVKSADPGKETTTLMKSTIGALAGKVVEDGFAASSAWLAKADLDEQETAAFAERVHPWRTRSETGKWISLLAEKLPPDQIDAKVGGMFRQWTRDDYRAAGEWLNSAPSGPARNSAVTSYAATVAPHEPASAAQWALTLEAGPSRDALLKEIHGHWKNRDPDAAEVFARKHGIAE